jgi:hypothetical protein
MKFKAVIQDNDVVVVTEDGGIATIHNNGDNFVTTYYQSRLTDVNDPEELWQELGEGKTYSKDWGATTIGEMIYDILQWLCVSSDTIDWELDESIWPEFNL